MTLLDHARAQEREAHQKDGKPSTRPMKMGWHIVTDSERGRAASNEHGANTEDNADYTPPRGVKGEYDRLNEIRSKEQSLVLKFNNLPSNHSGVAQKTLYTLNG